jgi:hypothetical protein
LPHAVALSFRRDDGGVVSEPIEKGGGELLVASEDRHPIGKRQIRRDDDAAPLVARGDEIEEQLAAAAIEGHESELVELCGAAHKSINGETAVMSNEER